MNSQTRFGKTITLAAIVTILAVIVVIYNIMSHQHQLPIDIFELFIALTCGQLYMGSRWARWCIGSLLLLFGCMFSYHLFTLKVVFLSFPEAVFVVLGICSLVSGLVLMFSKSVLPFLDKQRTNRSIVASRTLKTLWIVLLVAYVVVVYDDVKRVFF